MEDETVVRELREKLQNVASELVDTKSENDRVYDKWKVNGHVLRFNSTINYYKSADWQSVLLNHYIFSIRPCPHSDCVSFTTRVK